MGIAVRLRFTFAHSIGNRVKVDATSRRDKSRHAQTMDDRQCGPGSNP